MALTLYIPHMIYVSYSRSYFLKLKLIYSIVLVSGISKEIQLHIHIDILFCILLHCRLL